MTMRLRRSLKKRLTAPDGKEHDAWPRSEAARIAGVAVRTIKLWHLEGKVPWPILRGSRRSAYYTAGQIKRMKKFAEAQQKVARTNFDPDNNRMYASLRSYMKRTWNDGC